MIRQGRMTGAGLHKIRAGKKSGEWYKTSSPGEFSAIPLELKMALAANKKAKEYFDSLSPSYRRQFIIWIATAKREETREKRIEEAIRLLEQNRKLGLL